MEKTTHFSKRLSFRQTQYTLVVAFVTGLVFSCLQIALDYRHQNQAIDDEITALLEISSAPASRISYNIDSELAQELLNGLIRSPSVISAEIRDDTNQRLGYVRRDSRQDQARWISDSLFGRSRIYRQVLKVDYDPDEPLGFIQLEVDTFNYGSSFLQRALTTFFTGLVKGLMMALILLLLFYRMLTSPLMALTKSLSKLRSHEPSPSSHLTCPEAHKSDEIGLLIEEINNLLYSISSNTKRRYRAERQLRDHLATLESGIVSRTAELNARNRQLTDSNQELEDARQRALQMAQARATLLASMSHEIRTPLGSLLGLVDLAKENATEYSQQTRLALAHESGKQLLQLLNDILDFSRFESGKLVFESLNFDIHNKVEMTVEQFSQQAAQKQIALQCIIDSSVPQMVKGDPTRLQQIITNLVSNAIKFTKAGHVAVLVEARAVANAKTLINIAVSDTGIGIPENRLETIFQPFSQATAETHRVFGGSGLGLALSRNMAEALGGRLQARNIKGGGSRFELQLPYQNVQQATSEQEALVSSIDITILAPPLLAEALYKYSLDTPGLNPSVLSWYGPWHPDEMNNALAGVFITNLPEHLLPKAPKLCIPVYQHGQTLPQKPTTPVIHSPIRKKALGTLKEEVEAFLRGQKPDQEIKVISNSPEPEQRTILVVEDNPTNLMVTEGMLEQMGFHVKTARNGQQCLDICKETLFDLILMDCNMPVMNGYDASRNLRKSDYLKDVPIIALTANALEHDKDRCLHNGMQDYMSKPLDRKVLQAKLSQWIKTTR
ncbi:ATP-binding protein [Parendozoicomonas sp. Alg238-R29]|uniref:hybrid sensor histidine kinase/response regulator n=1 Tax=Parendozoicomonas sp. Alg238-R29 TaxID=2993446 RepID=UPI00248E2220|nr:ATP-binding protein [Parendozoicomonas sp. Alg238-R29]